MIDALDTMYIMGLHEEFDRGVKLVEKIDFAGANVRPFSTPSHPLDVPRAH